MLWFVWILAMASLAHARCAMYGDCGKKSVFGKQLPCPADIEPPQALPETLAVFERVCGKPFPAEQGLCCSYSQLATLELDLKRIDPLVSSCPACRQNFYDFVCHFTCLPDQAAFMEITATGIAADTHNDIVTELSIYTDPEYAHGFFDSCKNIKFAATNGYAMDLIGGGAKNYSQFLKFLGDEKPLLGGSPFQINFDYAPPANLSWLPISGPIKACDDPNYKCACSDCPSSCPALPPVPTRTCHVGRIPCFSFAVMLVWLLLFLLIGIYHMHLARKRRREFDRLSSLVQSGLESDDDEVADSEQPMSAALKPIWIQWATVRAWTVDLLEPIMAKSAFWCAVNPRKTLFTATVIVAALCSGLSRLEWEMDPVQLWVSPSEPALHNLQYFEAHFGEWFRIEQIIVSSADPLQSVMLWENVQWWFSKELELQVLKDGNHTYELDQLCFKPMGDTCALELFTQYFGGDIRYLSEATWANDITACAESPVTCLPTFQQPLKKNILFSQDDVLLSQAFVVTLLLDSRLTDSDYTAYAQGYERALQAWVRSLQLERPDLHIAFSTEVSLGEELARSASTDVPVVITSYTMMFLYASLALGKVPLWDRRSLVHTRFLLGLSSIIFIAVSVCAAAGACAYLGIKLTLVIAEVIPFLVLAVGVDNVFLLVNEVRSGGAAQPSMAEERIARAMARVGPSCLLSAVLQLLVFLLAATVQMPAVRNFAFYSAAAVALNFALQMTAFVAVLALDERRLEAGRLDIVPWVALLVQLDADESVDPGSLSVRFSLTRTIRDRYAPWLLGPKIRGLVLAVFLTWTGLLLALLPRMELGLDQRLALPADSYLVDYFDAVYKYLNVGPPVFFVLPDLDLTKRENQQAVCGKFSACAEFSVANVLEQEYQRGAVSTLAEPATNWLDDFFGWMNPALDQCCRVRASPRTLAAPEFCPAHAPPRQCAPCLADTLPPYGPDMEALPTDELFMDYFRQWITEPSDPCPLGGKAPYSAAVNYTHSAVVASYLRSSHRPLRSQADFISALHNANRIVAELRRYLPSVPIFAFLPFYVFFVQYENIVLVAVSTLAAALALVWGVSSVLLALLVAATALTGVVACIVVNVAGIMAVWGISLNAVSLVNLVICAGLAVEFTVHLARAYVACARDDSVAAYSHFMGSRALPGRECAARALSSVGASIVSGITFTKLIGIAVLAFARSQIFQVFYFRMWLALVLVASVHSLVLLPVVLSMLE